ncbi:dockerin type I domain-containing protein [Janthinobacterium sp.]|uniref:dockerin type I domain-containing protein n=1 Tax=Janthinobacterium sp. TaxID=1871054 RepID=UPI002DB60BF3|nr:dockerin type I domain-containing protein [Janthinobacterium sp.]HEU4819424.1 dockerin type I domain-containing protein [Janthinobacterium sp.]
MSMSLPAAVLTAACARACRRCLALLLLLALGLGVARAQSVTLNSPSAGQNFVNQSTITFAGTSTSGTASCRRVSVAMVIDGAEQNCAALASGVRSYSCTAALGIGGHTARAHQTINDVLCGTGRVFHNYSGDVSFTITRAAAVSVAINTPAPGSQLGQNSVTASATASTGTLGGLQNGEKLRLSLLLDGVQVSSVEGNGTTLPVSAPLLLEGGKHTLVAKAQYLDRDNAQLAQADSSAAFTIVPVNTSLLLIGHGPSPELNFERSVLRYDGKSGSFIGYFGAACHALDLSYGPDGRLYILDAPSNTFGRCEAPYPVRRFDGRTGTFDEIDDEHANYVQYGQELKIPASMAFGPDGNLYIADDSFTEENGAIYRYQGPYAPNPGELIDTFVTPAESHFRRGGKIHFGPDGALYLASPDTNEILRYAGPASAEPGRYMGTFVAPGSGGLQSPSDFLFRADGMLYVASVGKVLRYAGPAQASPGAFLGEFGTVPAALAGIATGPRDALYASGDGQGSDGVWRINGASGKSEGLFAHVEPGQHGTVGPLLFSSIPLAAASLGDFNGDGCVDRSDLDELMAHILGGVTEHTVADLNGDGYINVADARKLTALFSRPGGAPCR